MEELTKAERSLISEAESDGAKFIDAAIQNPDTERRGGIPDLVNGPSFTRSQTISTTVDMTGVNTATADVWVVQWDHESRRSDPTILGRYFTRNANRNRWNWYTGGETFSMPASGVCIYVMDKGSSPFPSTSPDVIGPVAPIKTIDLLYDTDVLGDNTRVVGSDIQVKYVGPEVFAKGVWTQSTQSSYPIDTNNFFSVGGDTTIQPFDQIYATVKSLPPGDIPTMVKYPDSVQRPAFDGILQSAIINLHDNIPGLPRHAYKLYRGPVPAGAANNLDLFVAQHRVPGGNPFVTPMSPYWDSNCEMHWAVCTGVDLGATLQVIRRITVETFPSAGSDLIAFAHPSPLSQLSLLEGVMNAYRTEQRFFKADDNASGFLSKTLKKGVKSATKVAKVMAAPTVNAAAAAYLPPGAMQAMKAAKQVSKSNNNGSTSQQDAINNLRNQLKQLKMEHNNFQTETLKLAKASRKRTKPASKS